MCLSLIFEVNPMGRFGFHQFEIELWWFYFLLDLGLLLDFLRNLFTMRIQNKVVVSDYKENLKMYSHFTNGA